MRLSRYALSWPESIHRYSHYLRAPAKDVSEAKATAIPLPNENAPYLQYQDALDQPRAGLTDAFAYYTWLTPQYPAHRGLLRFTAGDYVRFERVFSWLDSGLQSKTVAGSVATNLIEIADYYDFPKRMGDYGTALTAYWTTNTSYLANRSRGVNGDWRLFVGNNAADNASVGSISGWTLEVLLTNRLTSASWTTNFTNTTLLALVPGSTAFGQYSDTSINTVTGITNEVVGIRVALRGVTNRFASEIEAFLVSPRNGTCAVLSDGGGLVAVDGWDLTFADDAAGTIPSPLSPSEALLPHRPTDNVPNDPLPPGTVGDRVPRLGDLLLTLNLPGLPTPPPEAPWPSGTNAPTVVEEQTFVGRRIDRPASLGDGPIAGYISTNQGTAYSVSAYRSPLAVGFSEAVKGAIIPVNARPGFDSLEVWWFRSNGLSEASRNAGFKDILWPEALGLYDLEWPTSDPPIVLASNDGSGALPSDQAEGLIYYQNDSTLPGYNPNEEHALMQGGQAYALRDDLNVTGGDSYSSAPMVLVEYTASDGRPNMRAFPVVRERPEEGETFDYRVDAGTILQPPMPLPLLETPFAPDKPGQLRVSLNEEVPSWTNATATLQGATWSLSGRQPHFFRRFDLLVLQDPTKYATGGLPRWLLVTNTSPSSLSGILSTSAPYTLSEYVGTQPGGSSFRYNVDRETSLSKNIAVHIANPDQRLAWDAQIKEINTLDGWIEILFTTSVPSAAADATMLLVTDTATKPADLGGRRVGFEAVPSMPDAQAELRERYSGFVYEDRKGNSWVYRGPHSPGGNPVMTLQFYYKTLPGFFFPSLTLSQQPPVGTVTPYLRSIDPALADGFVGDGIFGNADTDDQRADGNALGIRYRAAWPTHAPTLQMAETLLTPKRGLPAVRGQTSMEILYEQSQATREDHAGTTVLHDPTRPKKYPLVDKDKGSTTALASIPSAIETSSYRGKVYFPSLPPHLSDRFYFDPNEGKNGSLVLVGRFVDAGFGEDYLQPNILATNDFKALVDLCEACWTPPTRIDGPGWSNAIRQLSTTMEQFVPSKSQPGTFVVDPSRSFVTNRTAVELAEVVHSDVAVDSYALTAVGPGIGYVSLIAGQGSAFTPENDPVSVHVIRVDPELYRGEVVPIESSNPLAEKLTLQQTIDLAGRTADYLFQWKIAAPVDGLPPRVYTTTTADLIPSSGSTWKNLSYPRASDTPASIEGTAAERLGTPVATQVVVVDPVAYRTVSKQGLRFEFATAPTLPHRLTAGVPVTVRLQDGTGIPGTISSLTTANNVVVDPAANAANNVAVRDIVGLDERQVAGLPQGYLYQTFSRDPAVPLSDVWMSLDLDAGLGAEVFVDGQSVVRAQTAADASAPGTAPDTLDTLALAYRIPTSALAGGRTKPDGRREHLVVVALHAPAVPGASLRFDLRLQALTATDITDRGWLPMDPERYADGIRAILGGKADVQALSDNYIIMRYRAAKAGHASYVADPDSGWSPWTQPALAEGWIKRVLRGINPFNQRVTDLFNNQISTDVSIVAQAGPRWEGDVALNQDNLNDAGLIEIYETVLNRGKKLSIHAGINYGPANDALLLAAGYLADLYMMLGNEAWADASNPTIGIGTADRTYGDIATALFSFKGQLPTLLEEELALLRGRDDALLPGVETAPVYNRLVWNYTRGIDSGETIYSLNYNILDQNGDGRVDASDAQKLYPQGHGDAYGHYLTALTGYYQLLLDPDFDWVPRIEAVNVLGKPVSVDYQDERKFAAAAAAVARTGKSIVDLTWRQQYASDPAKGWSQFAETKTHDRTTANALRPTRYWGLDHWAVRTGQGAFLNWIVGNAILPDKDTDPDHTGSIQQVDRDTVPELRELSALGTGVQATVDNAEGFLTPLGLAPNSIPFDLNPLSIANGNKTTHFEQIYERAKEALGNALVAFDDAKDVTRLMRSEEDSLADLRSDTKQQELTYKTALVELYGTPYTDDIGPGKTYPAGYDGPDLVHSMYVDNVELAFGSMLVPSSNTTWRVDIQTFNNNWLSSGRVVTKDGKAEAAAADDRISDFGFIKLAKAFAVDGTSPAPEYLENRSLFVEYNLAAHGFSKPPSWQGRRASPGRIQQSISDIIKARNAAFEAFYVADAAKDNLDWAIRSLDRRIASHSKVRGIETLMRNIDTTLKTAKTAAGIVDKILETMSHEVGESLETIASAAPLSFIAGAAAGGDLTSSARALLKANGLSTEIVVDWKKVASFSVISGLELLNDELMKSYQVDINDENWKQELRDATSEIRDLVYGMQNQFTAINAALQELDDAQRAYRAALAEGDRIQAEREVFRQRSAAIVQGYRTRDAAFRVFRSEKLERYKMLFDLAAQYTYMAAQAFDYETGLLHTQRGREFIDRIVRSRALGVMPDGEPQFAGSNTGDPGLSSVMAEMASDWSVLKTRLGFKNPDAYGTTVSLREENFRILPGEDHDSAWIDRLEAGRTDNLLADPDVRRYCMQIDPKNGLPVPGIVLEFGTVVADGVNLFGRPLAPGDHTFSPAAFATKIFGVGVSLEGYRWMEAPNAVKGDIADSRGTAPDDPDASFLDPDAMSATPYIYLVPVGVDSMRSPPLGDTSVVRSWKVDDIAIPLPFNIGGSDHSTAQLWQTADSLSEPLFSIRKHQPFRPVPSATVFGELVVYWTGGELERTQYNNTRLLGRSVWNSRWKLIIPGRTLLADPHDGLDRFIRSVKDVRLYFMTYSYSGN